MGPMVILLTWQVQDMMKNMFHEASLDECAAFNRTLHQVETGSRVPVKNMKVE